MKRLSSLSVLALAVVATTTVVLHADTDRLRDAALVLTEMAGAADTGIPQNLLGKAQCVVIIPGVKKAALGVGGQYGRGYISCRTSAGWSAPGGVRIEGGSVGFQIGGSDTDVILLVLNERGVDRLLSSKFTVGADASVAAGPIGRSASAQTDATMMAEILAWSRSRGVFAGISLQGSTLREDTSENKDLYGAEISNKEIVKGTHAAPAPAADLMTALGKY
ncbi:MAG: lipid-binding SYLF domain-containing protein [Acidobacteriota bacterium]